MVRPSKLRQMVGVLGTCFLRGETISNYDICGAQHRPHDVAYSLTTSAASGKRSSVAPVESVYFQMLISPAYRPCLILGMLRNGGNVRGGERYCSLWCKATTYEEWFCELSPIFMMAFLRKGSPSRICMCARR